MERRLLGTTGMEISVVGFGAWAIGGPGVAAGHLGPADDGESVGAIHRALELGVDWIDTAPGYGLGHSEEVVGRAIAKLNERPHVFTKCGFVWDETGALTVTLAPHSLRNEVEQSLRRLGVEAIDLYQIHWLEPENDPEIEEGWATLADLKREGKLRHIGVSNFTIEQLERAKRIAPVETVQPPYSLVERSAEPELLPYCLREQIGVIVYSPMQTGLLTGAMTRERIDSLPEKDVRRLDPNFQEPLLSRNLEVVERLQEIAARRGVPAGRLAVAWTLRHPAVTAAIVGFRRPGQVSELLGDAGLDLELGEEELAALELLEPQPS
jgi:aryl-alcohol dehydrogenase-like predicted oxidoreductase